MSEALNHYTKLHEISRQTRILQGIDSLLQWDQETYMPEDAAAIRAEQQKTMAGLIHSGKIGKPFVNALAKLIDIKTGKVLAKGLGPAKNAALKVWRREYLKDVALPTSFVKDFAKLTSQSILIWRSAKKENSFRLFAPYLEKIVQMCRKKATLLGFKDHPYDALLDEYEPEMTTKRITPIFAELKKFLVNLLQKIQKKPQVDDHFLFGKFAESKQMAFTQKILEGMRYDKRRGRLDFSVHPFSSAAHPTDSRITTRLHPTYLLSNIRSVMHEAGHGLYEMGLPVSEYGSPLGEHASLGIHESQSRWWETRIGQGLPFWNYYYPILQKEFKAFEQISLKDFYRGINKVEPSFIRVEADEVTYNLHVILRFEIEKALIEGSLAIKEIPQAWNAKFTELFGLVPGSDAEGCLQDIHWSMGSFGYFPTYTLGNLYAGQFFAPFTQAFPDWEKRVADGDLKFINDWLEKSIFQYGRQYSSFDLVEKVSGASFSSQPFCHYLETKYRDIYHF